MPISIMNVYYNDKRNEDNEYTIEVFYSVQGVPKHCKALLIVSKAKDEQDAYLMADKALKEHKFSYTLGWCKPGMYMMFDCIKGQYVQIPVFKYYEGRIVISAYSSPKSKDRFRIKQPSDIDASEFMTLTGLGGNQAFFTEIDDCYILDLMYRS